MFDETLPPMKPVRAHGVRPRWFLFLVLEAARPTGGSARIGLDRVDVIEIGRGEERKLHAWTEQGRRCIRLQVPDPWMSRTHARLTRHLDALTLEDAESSNGTFVDGTRISSAGLEDGARLELGHTVFSVRRLPASRDMPEVLDASEADPGLATVVPRLEDRLAELVRVALSTVSVVLRGPSGSGKEVLAGIVHDLSGRPGRLVAINCGAIPENLVEAELFGHRRGAFSGASTEKPGLVASADHGTLFLDEIGDLPLSVQPALLRVLQDRVVTPLGAAAGVPVDFRVVAATHRDLEAMVQAGTFREDLWARLKGFEFELPPLADRREDLGTLLVHLYDRLAPDRDVVLTPDVARALVRYAWPRNVRELEKTLETALALAGDGPIDLQHLPAAITDGVPRSGIHPRPPDSALEPMPQSEDPRRAALEAALRTHNGNVSAVARALGKPRSQIQRWMRRWGLRGTA